MQIPSFAGAVLLCCASGASAASFWTNVQGVNADPSTVIGTTSVFINEDQYAIVTPNTMHLESRAGSAGMGVHTASWAVVDDTYTLHGPAGTTITVTAAMDIDYVITPHNPYYQAEINTRLLAAGIQERGHYYQRNTSEGYATDGNTDVGPSVTFDWTVGQTQQVIWEMSARTLLSVHIDAGQTATFNFDLPAGYWITSELGWVPEPATLSILPAWLLLVGRQRGRSRRGA